MNPQMFETLEARRLFAGVTLLTHGWNGNITEWIATAAQDITAQLGGPSQVPEYILTLTPDTATDGHLVPSITHVAGTTTPQANSTGEILLVVDWTSVSTNADYSLAYIGSVVADYMMDTPVDGVTLADLPIHEISQSRGVGLLDAINATLGPAGVWINQETYLDPHTISVMGDPAPTIFDNVEFADNYWRSDGNPADDAMNGQPVDGAYNLNVSWLDTDDGGAAGYGSVHDAVTGYYVGTIDQTATQGGDGPIYPDWYGTQPGQPARDATGWLYSSIMGGARPTSGLWAASGGTGDRTPTVQSGTQWPDVTDLSVTSASSLVAGQNLGVRYLYQDRGANENVTLYLDTDQNPYDNNFADTLGSTTLAESQNINAKRATFSTSGVAPGTYYLCAVVTDSAGNTRYAYSTAIDITAPAPVTSGFVANYYADGFNGPSQLSRIDNAIDFNFASDPIPTSTLSADDLAANWSGHVIAPATGQFSFYATSTGRVIIWINGEEILDHSGNGTTEFKSDGAMLNAGQRYLIRVKYFGPSPATKPAMIKIAWAAPGITKATVVGGALDGPNDDNAIVPLIISSKHKKK